MREDTLVGSDFFSNSFINDYAKNYPSEIKFFDNRPFISLPKAEKRLRLTAALQK